MIKNLFGILIAGIALGLGFGLGQKAIDAATGQK